MTPDERSCDVLVVGSGAAGSMAALVAASRGLDVILVEKEDRFGGTTALSGGWVWAPCNGLAEAIGLHDVHAAAVRYIQHEARGHGDLSLVEAFVAHAGDAVEFLQSNTPVLFDCSRSPDYHCEAPGGSEAGRALMCRPLNGRELGEDLALLQPPLAELTVLGMMLGSGREVLHFMRATRSLRSAAFVTQRMARQLVDLARFGRGMSLTNGNALAGRFLLGLRQLGVPIHLGARATSLLQDDSGVHGAVIETTGKAIRVRARRGVVLACGGFSRNLGRMTHAPHLECGGDHFTLACPGADGDGIRLAQAAGAKFDHTLTNAAAWVPVSIVPRPDGSSGVFPHFVDRGKPGVIAVAHHGGRFVNEATNYHDFVQAMIQASGTVRPVRAYLICDHSTLRRYGLGAVLPSPVPIGRHLRSGYLVRGANAADLAGHLGIDPIVLKATLERCNRDAREGRDSAFGKGDTVHNRHMGDSMVAPNPCFGPIHDGPLYCVRLAVGDLGTFQGIRTDVDGRALDEDGHPIGGLYVAGNDMDSVFAGSYPGAGATLGAAVTFGFIAADSIARSNAS